MVSGTLQEQKGKNSQNNNNNKNNNNKTMLTKVMKFACIKNAQKERVRIVPI